MFKRIFSILFVSYSVICNSQEKNYIFDNLQVQDGLSHPTINCIAQDSMGFLWIGTQNGLNRYDGYEFKVYKAFQHTANGLTSNYIKCLHVDRTGNLWVGTGGGGLLKYNRDFDSFTSYTHTPGGNTSIGSNDVYSLAEDNDGVLWAGTYGGGLSRLDPANGHFEHYQVKTGLSNNNVRALYADKYGNLWIGTDGGGLNLLKKGSRSITHFSTRENDPHSLSSNAVMCITGDPGGRIWVGTYGGGINILNRRNGRFTRLMASQANHKSMSHNIVWCFFHASDTVIWAGTRGGGINIINTNTLGIRHIKSSHDNPNGINSDFILSIAKDKSGIVWIGNEGKGLNKLNMQKQNFAQISTSNEVNAAINGNKISSIFEESPRFLWVGTYDNGLYLLDRTRQVVTRFSTNTAVKLHSQTVLAISKDRHGNMWIGTDGEGIDILNTGRNSVKNIRQTPESNSLSNNAVHAITRDSRGNMWVGTWGGGLNKYDDSTRTFSRFHASLDPMKDVVMCIYEDLRHDIWVGTYGAGIGRLNSEHRQLEMFLDKISVFSITQKSDPSFLWLGSQGNGLIKFDTDTKSWTSFTERNGLSSDIVSKVVADRGQNLWVTTINGLSFLPSNEEIIRRYDVNDGLLSNEFTPGACIEASNGRIITGGMKGVNTFDPASLAKSDYSPTLHITNFYVFNKPVNAGDNIGNFVMEKHISQLDQLVIPYNLNVISFDFAAIDFHSPGKILYAYKLDGFDQNWNYTGAQRRFITYTQLEAGTYTLRIKSSNSDGKWTGNSRTIKIIVKPPFWRTSWFLSLILMAVVSLIFAYVRFKTSRVIKDKERLQEKVKERTLELELRNEEIVRQSGKILVQNEQITDQNEMLERQRKELELHRNDLEQVVDQRTRELREALRMAEGSDKLKTAFLTNMSHEIRTPMNAIVGLTSLLTVPDLPEEKKIQYASLINKHGDTLVRMIEDIIELSKIESGHANINNNNVHLNNFILALEHVHHDKALLEGKNIDLVPEIDEENEAIVAYTDESRINQVMSNFIDNAIKYTSDGEVRWGYKIIETRSKQQEVEFFVSDTGIGIEKEKHEEIFKNFTKVENKGKLFQGTGIGLALCRSIVKILGGKIWLESVPGRGSTFYFSIPMKSGSGE